MITTLNSDSITKSNLDRIIGQDNQSGILIPGILHLILIMQGQDNLIDIKNA